MDNYSNPDYVFNMQYDLATKLIKKKIEKLIEKEKTEKRWQLYLTIYPYIITGKLKEIEFVDFCKALDGNTENKKTINDYKEMSDEEMLKEIEKIENEAKNK